MPNPPDPETTVTGYLEVDHDRLDELLIEATECIAAKRFDEARGTVARFAEGLNRQIRMEDEVVFPTFERLTGLARGPTAVMRGEHRELERLVTKLVATVDASDRIAFLHARHALLVVLGEHNDKAESVVSPATDQNLHHDERVRFVQSLRAFH